MKEAGARPARIARVAATAAVEATRRAAALGPPRGEPLPPSEPRPPRGAIILL